MGVLGFDWLGCCHCVYEWLELGRRTEGRCESSVEGAEKAKGDELEIAEGGGVWMDGFEYEAGTE